MLTPGSIFINFLVVLSASAYWFMSGHAVPAILGYLVVLVYISSEKLYFTSDILAILALVGVIVYFFVDYAHYEAKDGVLHFGMGVLYMIVIYLKTRQIFNNE